jgi:hypothetical protein
MSSTILMLRRAISSISRGVCEVHSPAITAGECFNLKRGWAETIVLPARQHAMLNLP